MFYLPPGSMMQLMDGRVLHKDTKTNLWHDNMGVPITEQQLQFMVSFPSFSEDPSGGGDSPVVAEAPAEPPAELTSVSLSAPFDDILEVYESTVTGTNRTVVVTGDGPVTLTVNFEAGGLYSGGIFRAFKNDTTQVMSMRASGIASPSPITLSETFANGDQLKFQVTKGANNNETDFDVTISKTAPGSTDVLDTFRVYYFT